MHLGELLRSSGYVEDIGLNLTPTLNKRCMKHWHKCIRWWTNELPCPFQAMEEHSEECEESREGSRIADEAKPRPLEEQASVRPFVEAVVRQGAAPLAVWQAINYLAIQYGSKAITNADAFSTKRHNLGRGKASVRGQYLEKRLSRAFGQVTKQYKIGKYPRVAPGARGVSGLGTGKAGGGARRGGRKGGAMNFSAFIAEITGQPSKRKLRWRDMARYGSQDASFPHAL